jgi:dCMP deaminase
MNIAKVVATRSKDPSTKVGAVLVDSNNHIIGTGYNGMPTGWNETEECWKRPNKYDYVLHAELNCLLHSTISVKGSKLYVTEYPCKECAKLIAASGITNIYYAGDKYYNGVSKNIFNALKIEVNKL